MSNENATSRSLVGATNLIFLDGAIFKAQSDYSSKSWVIAQATAHITFGSPTKEEMVGIKSQYKYWQAECSERAKRVSMFLLSIDIEVPELGIMKA